MAIKPTDWSNPYQFYKYKELTKNNMTLSQISKAQCKALYEKFCTKEEIWGSTHPAFSLDSTTSPKVLEDFLRSSHVAIIMGMMEKIISEDRPKIGEEVFSKDYFRGKLEQRSALLTYLKEELENLK